MSKFVVKINHLPTLGPDKLISRDEMRLRITALPIRWRKIKLTDFHYYASTWDDWRKIIEYELPRIPKYYVDKFDCENFAGWFRHQIAIDFEINTFAEVEGYANLGKGMERHGWGLFTDGKHFFQVEPQTGVIMDIDDHDYIPDEIVMG